MDRLETAALLRRAREGSSDDLEQLFARCAGKLQALIRIKMGRELRSRLESQDVLQSCLMKSFQRIDQFERSDSGSLMAWLARIAENEIHDLRDFHLRHKRDARQEVTLDIDDGRLAGPMRSALSQVILDERALRLEEALETLLPEHRDVIVLRRLEELSWREVAGRLGKSEDACRMQFSRAMTALTLQMERAP